MQDGELPPLQADGDGADGCRPAGRRVWPAVGRQEPTSSSRLDRRRQGPAEPPPQRVAKRRGRGLLPPWAGEGKDGDERGLCC